MMALQCGGTRDALDWDARESWSMEVEAIKEGRAGVICFIRSLIKYLFTFYCDMQFSDEP
jgi:hypothetical protein